MLATVIIGANFGDEGKGNLTDYHAESSMIVRFNGGANCGHTVVRNGKTHIFRHFGSGTLRNAPTFLSRYFINNPILYFKELEILRGIDVEPLVFVDPDGLVTTPWDMMINQIAEEHRGINRHGSCGVGINETLQRHLWTPLFVSNLQNKTYLQEICHSIANDWVSYRLDILGIEPTPEWKLRLQSSDIFDRFLEHCDSCVRMTHIMSISDALKRLKIRNLVFEGGQGLLLDEHHRFFPHVTHSSTGGTNVSKILSEMNIHEVDVIYATRAYLHRHGAGPFPHEDVSLSYKDETNLPNDWQGTLRFGHFDLDLLMESIQNDQKLWQQRAVEPRLAIMCLDQVPDEIRFWQSGKLASAPRIAFIQHVCGQIGVKTCLLGYGPEASKIIVTAV